MVFLSDLTTGGTLWKESVKIGFASTNTVTFSLDYSTTPTQVYTPTTVNANYIVSPNYISNMNAGWNSNWFVVDTTYEPPTAEQKQKAKERAEKQQAAKRTARDLLISFLDETQRESFEEKGSFLVVGSDGGLYQIRTGRSMNIREIDAITMKPVRTLCAHPSTSVPDFDTMLSQMFWLVNDEKAFNKIANSSAVVGINDVPEIILPYAA